MRIALAVRTFLALPCLWLGLTSMPAAADEAALRIGRNEGPMALLTDSSVLVLRAAYDKLNVSVRFEEYPLLRSLALADAGTIDGDTMRIAETSERYHNLIRIDVPINHLEITTYARAPCPEIKDWSELRGRRVAHERGVLAIERRLAGMETIAAANKPELFRLLDRGMADIVVGTGLETDVVLRRLNDNRLCRVNGTLERVPLYHYLHKRHAALAPRLEAQLQGMQKRGEIDGIHRRERARVMAE